MAVEVKIPVIGESISEGTIAEWLKVDGDAVAVDEPILVLETDKVTMNVAAAAAGRLAILVAAGSEVAIGQVVGTIDETATGAVVAAVAAAPATRPDLSPAVRRLVEEHGLDPSAIAGSGRDGRLLKEDVQRHLASSPAPATVAVPTPAPAAATTPAPAPAPAAATSAPATRQTRQPMSRLRQRLAERLVAAQHDTATLTTFNEVDMSRVMALRATYKEQFKERHDVGLGFMSFFVKAVVDALKAVPEVNAFIDGGEVVVNHYYDIGVAVSSDKGLVVPVVRDADRLSMAAVEREVARLAARARDRTLELSDLSGAVFTISNGGIFGSLLSTPILNPPQSAILGMHAIKKRPVVVDDQIVIRPMMYLALSYDHRLVDGREAVTFLKRVVDCLESPERLLLEV
jgi:2-oxoglutarate dehydrogenase E2 component (dihydrolipoamide succinyltransferase)